MSNGNNCIITKHTFYICKAECDPLYLYYILTRDVVYESACSGFSKILKSLNDRNLSLNVDKTVFMPYTINKTELN